MVEADVLVDAVFGCRLAHVIENPRPVGDRLGLGPRLERIAEREHVAVGADAGITKQVPGAADGVATFEDRVALARALVLKVIARADAGEAGADDQHVEMFACSDRLHLADTKDVDARHKAGHDENISSVRYLPLILRSGVSRVSKDEA